MPPMPGSAAGTGAGFFSGMSATRDSVVSTVAATEAAFCSALRVTLVGSMMPRLNHIDVLVVQRVIAVARLLGALDLLDDDGAFHARVGRDLANRLFQRAQDDAARRSSRRR